MRTDNRFLVLSTLGGLLTAASCTLITDVDRTKIPTDAGTPAEGGQGAMGGTGGKAGSGGKAGTAGRAGGGAGGSSGSAQGGEGGGEAGGSSGGTAGATGGTSGTSGTSGSGGSSGSSGSGGSSGTDAGAGGEAGGSAAICGNASVESGEACDDGNISVCGTCAASCDVARTIPVGADGALVIGSLTYIMDGDTITLDDGTNNPKVFEFECAPPDCPNGATGVTSGSYAVPFTAVNFDGLNDETEYRDLLIAAIEVPFDAGDSLTVATDGGSSPATVALSKVEIITDTVGNPNFVTSQRCTGGIGCASDADCLSLSCDTTAQTCD